MSKNKPCWIVDAFVGTGEQAHLSGNPAAVVIVEEWLEDAWLQELAAEFNLSETAFLKQTEENDWNLRWFTPTCEVDLCGHATLGSAAVLAQNGLAQTGKPMRFSTRSGLLTVTLNEGLYWLDFPAQPVEECELLPKMRQALGLGEVESCSRAKDDWLIELASQEEVAQLKPDFAGLRRISQQLKVRGVIVTAPANESGFDFASRFFAPGSGIDEDPVTGSAHTKLAPYWGSKLGKTELRALQVSPRGGFIEMRWKGERVLLGGKAKIRVQGEILD